MTDTTNDHRTEEELFCEKCGKTIKEEEGVEVFIEDDQWVLCTDCADLIKAELSKKDGDDDDE